MEPALLQDFRRLFIAGTFLAMRTGNLPEIVGNIFPILGQFGPETVRFANVLNPALGPFCFGSNLSGGAFAICPCS